MLETLETRALLAQTIINVTYGFPDIYKGSVNSPYLGYLIHSGDTTPSKEEGTDFGRIAVGSTVERTFAIRGPRLMAAKITGSLTLSGANASDFLVSTVSGTTDRSFKITFKPQSAGDKTAVVTIPNDSINASPYTFTVRGVGTASAALISVRSPKNEEIPAGSTNTSVSLGTDFGSMDVGKSTRQTLFTITNSGNADLNISGITTSSTEFVISQKPSATQLQPGKSATFGVTFTPQSDGSREATINVANSAPANKNYSFKVSGTGVASKYAEISVSVDNTTLPNRAAQTQAGAKFGTVVNNTSVTRNFVVRNTGSADLNISSVVVVGSGDFTITKQPNPVIGPGQTSTLTVRFLRQTKGSSEANIKIVSNSRNAGKSQGAEPEFVFRVEGSTGSAALTLSSTGSNVFDAVGQVTKTFSLKNTGDLPVRIQGNAISLTGTASVYFTAQLVGQAGNVTLEAGKSLDLQLTYTAKGATSGEAKLRVNGDVIQSNEVTLTAQTPQQGPANLKLTFLNNVKGYRDLNIQEYPRADDSTPRRTVVIENDGQGTLIINSIRLNTGPVGDGAISIPGFRLPQEAFDFKGTIAPGQKYSFDLEFNPASEDEVTGRLVINSNATNGKELTWTIGGQRMYSFRPAYFVYSVDDQGKTRLLRSGQSPADAQLKLGELLVGGPTRTQKFRIDFLAQNIFPYMDLGNPAMRIDTADPDEFKILSMPTAPIQRGQLFDFNVEMRARGTGTRTAKLMFRTNEKFADDFEILIEFTALKPPSPLEFRIGDNAPFYASTNDVQNSNGRPYGNEFGEVPVGDTVERTVTLRNLRSTTTQFTGTPRVQITGEAASDFSVIQDAASSIDAYGQTTFKIGFTPKGAGVRSAVINLTSDIPGIPSSSFVVRGTGKAFFPTIGVKSPTGGRANASTYLYDPQVVNQGAAKRTFTITNSPRSELLLTGSPIVKITGPGAADFAVTVQPSASIRAESTFELTFAPKDSGERRATIEIASNDASTPVYRFDVRGRGVSESEAARTFDFNGLRVMTETSFATSVIDDGLRKTVLDTQGVVLIGYVPSAVEDFKPVIRMPAGARIISGGGVATVQTLNAVQAFNGRDFQEVGGGNPENVTTNTPAAPLVLDLGQLGISGAEISGKQARRFSLANNGMTFKATRLLVSYTDAQRKSSTARIEMTGNVGFNALDNAGFAIDGENRLRPTDNGFTFVQREGDLALASSDVDDNGLPTPITFSLFGAKMQSGFSGTAQIGDQTRSTKYALKMSYKSGSYTLEGNMAMNVPGVIADLQGFFVIRDGNISKDNVQGRQYKVDRLSIGGLEFQATAKITIGPDAIGFYWSFNLTAMSSLDGFINGASIRFTDQFSVANQQINSHGITVSELRTKIGTLQPKSFNEFIELDYEIAKSTYTIKSNGDVSLTLGDKSIQTIALRDDRVLKLRGGRFLSGSFVAMKVNVYGRLYTGSDAANGRPSLFGEYDAVKRQLVFRGLATWNLEGNAAKVDFGGNGTVGLTYVTDANAFAVGADSYSFLLKTFRVGNLDWTGDNLLAIGSQDRVDLQGDARFTFDGKEVKTLFRTSVVLTKNGESSSVKDGFNYFITGRLKIGLELKPGEGDGADSALNGRYDYTAKKHFIFGFAAVDIGGRAHSADLYHEGTAQGPAGIEITGPTSASVVFSVPTLTIGNLNIREKDGRLLGIKYRYGDAEFTVSALTNLKIDNIEFPNSQATIKVSLSEQRVTSAIFSVKTAINFPQQQVAFAANSLSIDYDPNSLSYYFTGDGKYTFGNNVVKIGRNQPTQIVIESGNYLLIGFKPPPAAIKLGNVTFDDTGLVASLPDANQNKVLTGNKTLTIGTSSFQLNLGAAGTAGIRVDQNAQIQQMVGQLTSSFSIGATQFAADSNMRFAYDVNSNQSRVSGTTQMTFAGPTGNVALPVDLGSLDSPGVRLDADGRVISFSGRIAPNTTFNLLGLRIQTTSLVLSYASDTQTFGFSGEILITSASQGGNVVFNGYKLTLGAGPDKPGIRVVRGRLESLDVTMNGAFKVFALTFTPENLRLEYSASDRALQITGSLKVQLANKFDGSVSLPDKGILINTTSGKVQVKNLKISVADVKFGNLAVRDVKLGYDVNEDTGETTISGEGTIELPGKITVGAVLQFSGERLKGIGVNYEKNPGIPVYNVLYINRLAGKFENLDNLDEFKFTGEIGATLGPSMRIFNSTQAVANATGTVEISKGLLKVDAEVSLLGGKLGSGRGTLILNFNDQFIQFNADVHLFPGDILKGGVGFRLDNSGNVTFKGNLGVFIPDGVPLVGGKNVGALDVYLQIRPEEPRENSYFDASVKILFIKFGGGVNFAGRVNGFVDPPILPRVDFGFDLPGTRDFDLPTYKDFDPPTILVTSVTADAGKPTGKITFVGNSQLASQTLVDLYASPTLGDYQGRLIASDVPLGTGPQTYLWENMSDFAQPIPTENGEVTPPLYVYAVAKDGWNLPVFSPYTLQIEPAEDFSPFAVVPTLQRTNFGDSLRFSTIDDNAVTVVDPLLPFDPDSEVVVTLTTNSGRVQFGNYRDDVQVDDRSAHFVQLTGSADAITAMLEGMTYTPDDNSFFDDSISIAVTHAPLDGPSEDVATIPIEIGPLAIDALDVVSVNEDTTEYPLRGLDLSDAISGTATGATISLEHYRRGQDQLQLASAHQLANGIDATFDPSTGVLTLTGFAPLSAYEDALRRVQFETNSPISGQILHIVLSDDQGERGRTDVSLLISDQPEPMTITLAASASRFSGSPVQIFQDLTIHDSENQTLDGVVVYFDPATYVSGEDALSASSNSFTITFEQDLGALIIRGSGTASEYTNVLRTVQYNSTTANLDLGVRTVLIANLGETDHFQRETMHRIIIGDSVAEPTFELVDGFATARSDDAPQILAPDLSLTGEDSATIFGATINIGAGYSIGEDVLIATALPEGIDSEWNEETGTLELFGEASLEDYQFALQNIAYINLAGARTGMNRSISFAINDGIALDDPQSLTLIVPANPHVFAGLGLLEYETGKATEAIAPELSLGYFGGEGLLTGATVSITSNYEPDEDRLALGSIDGITGSFDTQSGTLTLSGQATVEEYEAALRSVTYYSLRTNPTASERLVEFTVFDGDTLSDSAEFLIEVDPDYFSSKVTVDATPEIFPEDGPPRLVLSDLTITSPDEEFSSDDERPIFSATVMLHNYVRGEDVLAFTQDSTGDIVGEFNAESGVLNFTGFATPAAYQAILRTVTYQNLSDAPSTLPRAIEITINDGSLNDDAATDETEVDVEAHADTPVHVSGDIEDVLALKNSTGMSLGLEDLVYASPAGTELPVRVFIVSLPAESFGQVVLADGSSVNLHGQYTVEQLQGLRFVPAFGSAGEDRFVFSVSAVDPLTGNRDSVDLDQIVRIVVSATEGDNATEHYIAQVFRDLLAQNPNASQLSAWRTELEAASEREDLVRGLLNTTDSRVQRVQYAYHDILNRQASDDEVGISLSMSIESLRTKLLSSDEFLDQHFASGDATTVKAELQSRQARTESLFTRYLRRVPTDVELEPYLDVFAEGGEDEVIVAILSSSEYFNLFSSDIDPESTAASVTTGSDDRVTDDFDSVGILGDQEHDYASGTLIAPRFVLVAGHSVIGRAPADLRFTLDGVTHSVVGIFTHNFRGDRIGYDEGNDIALIELAEPVTTIAPSRLLSEAPELNEMLTLVGYGQRGGSFGTKRVGQTAIDGVTPQLVTWVFDRASETNSAEGDSGAPLFVVRDGVSYIAAVVSGGIKAAASFGDYSYNTRVDVHMAWIESITGPLDDLPEDPENAAPTEVKLTQATVLADFNALQSFGQLLAIDSDTERGFHFVLAPGDGDTDNSRFQVVGNQLQTRETLDPSQTYSIRVRALDDSGAFHDSIISLTPVSSWQNPTGLMDVNGDTDVSATDALVIINEINDNGSGRLPPRAVMQPPYLDVSGNGYVSPLDVLIIVNEINARRASGGEAEQGVASPTGSAADLALASLDDFIAAPLPTSDWTMHALDSWYRNVASSTDKPVTARPSASAPAVASKENGQVMSLTSASAHRSEKKLQAEGLSYRLDVSLEQSLFVQDNTDEHGHRAQPERNEE